MANGYDNLIEIGGTFPAWLSCEHAAFVRRAARSVTGRTQTTAWLDRLSREVCFGYVRDNGRAAIAWTVPVFAGPGVPYRFDPVLGQQTEDDICLLIRQTRETTPALKEWRADNARKSRERSEKDAEMGRLDNNSANIERTAEREYVKYSMGRHYKGKVLVNGTKTLTRQGA